MFSDIKALIFDLDGTVADTIWAIREAVNDVRTQLGLSPLDYNEVKAGVNNGARNLVLATIADKGRLDDKEYVDNVLARYVEAYSRTYTMTDKPYDGMPEAIRILKARGLHIAMLSNKPDRFVRTLADKLFGGDVFEIARGPVGDIVKPDSRLTAEVLAQLDPSLKPCQCAMIGDSDVDIATATNAGMMSVGVAWGYRGRAFLEACGADAIIDNPIELIDIFR